MITLLFSALLLFFPASPVTGESIADAMKLMAAKDYEGARKILQNVIAQNESNAEAHWRLGMLQANHFHEYDDAEESLEKAVELAEQNAEYHFALGTVYGAQAQLAGMLSKFSYAKKTRDQFEHAVALQPDSIRYRSALFTYYLRAPGIVGGGVDKARVQAKEILGRDPFEGHMAFAAIAESENASKEAEKEYLLAVAAKPTSWRPHHLLGYLYLRLKRVDDALAQFKEYVRLAPQDPNGYDSLADGFVANGNTDDALKSYLQALAINPHFPSSLFGAGGCYQKKGMKTEALNFYNRYLAENPKGQYADKAKEHIEEIEDR
jgi:tetratricopeptide (TPR) repeat protein